MGHCELYCLRRLTASLYFRGARDRSCCRSPHWAVGGDPRGVRGQRPLRWLCTGDWAAKRLFRHKRAGFCWSLPTALRWRDCDQPSADGAAVGGRRTAIAYRPTVTAGHQQRSPKPKPVLRSLCSGIRQFGIQDSAGLIASVSLLVFGGRYIHTYIHTHTAQPQHTNYWAPRTRKRHQQEHRPQRPTESSDPTQHAKGRTGDCPGPRKETTTRRNVTRGVAAMHPDPWHIVHFVRGDRETAPGPPGSRTLW